MGISLKNKIVCITGASSGIGAACAEAFAEQGSNLILLARREDRLIELAESLEKLYGIAVKPFVCDVRDNKAVSEAFSSLPEQWNRIDILVNNAGLSRGLEPLQSGNVDNWEEMIDTNIKGLLYVARAVLPGMIERGHGTMINIASVAGRQSYPNGNVYCATKAAVRMLSETLQLDVNGTGVRITNIDPGLVETEFSLVRFKGDEERAENVYKGYLPLTANDVAELALFCATRPPHVSVQDVLVMPTAQASVNLLHKNMQ